MVRIESIQDVKNLLKAVSNSIEKSDPLHQQFKWYSEANFSVASEYYGELKLFLTRILIVDKISVPYEKELKKLLKQLKRIW